MSERIGRYTFNLPSKPGIVGFASVVGKKEGEGPLRRRFDKIYDDGTLGESSWEKSESAIHREAVTRALANAQCSAADADMLFAGDLLDQCIATSFGVKELNIPLAGMYGACSTMALSLAMAGILTDCGALYRSVASASSHFCSAEKQFRMPLEYGGQRPPSAQWTVTGAGAAVVGADCGDVKIEKAIIGKIVDFSVKDANNMGAAMAPAACSTITDFLRDTGTAPSDYDMILTGDLGVVGSKLLAELMKKQEKTDISGVHADCGTMIYNIDEQDVNSGGSGCGCSAAVLCSDILKKLSDGALNRVLFIGTGALMSPVSSLQGSSIPSIAHGVLLSNQ